MKLQRRLIEAKLLLSRNKTNIFLDSSKMANGNFSEEELEDLINKFLTEEEKAKILKKEEIRLILGEKRIENLVNSLGEGLKVELLHSTEFTRNTGKFSITRIICSLGEEKRLELLLDKNFVQKVLQLTTNNVTSIIESLETEAAKDEMIRLYQLDKTKIISIVETFSDEGKIRVILNNIYGLNKTDLEIIASTLSIRALGEFLEENEEALKKMGIKPYKIIRYMLRKEEQLEFIGHIENLDINIEDKIQILAMLDKDIKLHVDTSGFSQESIEALQMNSSLGLVHIDINGTFKKYRYLGDLAVINPMELSSKERARLEELFEACPQVRVVDNLGVSSSTIEEYRIGEEWIETVIAGINEEWTDIQKLAYVDHAVGKRISYSPDSGTEIHNETEARPLWKIIASGYGVCNGISQVEQYILKRIGIEAEMVSSEEHTFLKIKNIEIPTKEGGTTRGDTIVDPTWNLASQKYDAFPENFCKSYEEIRKEDIEEDGTDSKAHEIEGENETIGLDEQSLRNIFASIGLANENGDFKIKTLMDVTGIIDLANFGELMTIEQKILALSKYYTGFANSPNETIKFLKKMIVSDERLDFDRCVINKVYKREDENKKPIIYLYINLPETGKHFYAADKDTGNFIRMSEEEFEAKFECYETDIQKLHGNRPWKETRGKAQEER